MNAIAKFENLKDLIVELRGQSVLLDADVAQIYGVETKRINEAVKNNPDKFPHDYMFEIRDLCTTPLFVIPVNTGIQEVVDNTGYRPSPV